MKKITFFALLLITGICQHGFSQPSTLFAFGTPDSLYSTVLGEQRDIWIHLPEYFDPGGAVKYPVVYVLDGGVLLNAVATTMAYQSPAYMPEMIVVGIANRENRTRDLTTSKVAHHHDRPVEESGGAANFSRFIGEELIPYINKTYPTTPYRTLIGHSYGGLFTINMMMNHSHFFKNYIAIDPSMAWDDQRLLKQIKADLPKKNFKGKSFYLTIANEIIRFSDELDINTVVNDTTKFSLSIRSQLELVALLAADQSSALNFAWKYHEKEIHGTIPLISIYEGLRFLFDWYEIKSPAKFNDPSTPLEVLLPLVEARTQRLTEHFGYPVYAFDEELLNMLGYMYMDMGQTEKSLAFFTLNSHYYPDRPSVYDGLTDYYLAQEDLKNALTNAQRAFMLSANEVHQKRVDEIKLKLKKN